MCLKVIKKNEKIRLFHVSTITNQIDIMRYGLVENPCDMGIYFSDSDDGSVEWVLKREFMRGKKPVKLLLTYVDFGIDDRNLFLSNKGDSCQSLMKNKSKSYFYQGNIPPNRLKFEEVVIKKDGTWDYYVLDNFIKSKPITQNIVMKVVKRCLSLGVWGFNQTTGKYFCISNLDKLNDNEYMKFHLSGLNRKLGMINMGYLPDTTLSYEERVLGHNHCIKYHGVVNDFFLKGVEYKLVG